MSNPHEISSDQQEPTAVATTTTTTVRAVTVLDPLTRAWQTTQQRFNTRNWLWFLILGFINNYHYCVVISGAESVAELFHLKSLMALISWANIAGGIFVRFLNAFVLMHWSYNKKFLVSGLQTLFGLLVVCCSPYIGSSDGFRFFLTLFGILFIGNGSSFGEQASLAFLNKFPATTIGGWSSGTGFSGVIGSLVYLGLQNTGLNEPSIFAIQMPFVFVFWFAYYWGVVLAPKEEVKLIGDNNNNESENQSQEQQDPKCDFTAIPNYERSWKAELQPASSSASLSTSNSSGKSNLEMKHDNNNNDEDKPLLNDETSSLQNRDHNDDDDDDESSNQKQNKDDDDLYSQVAASSSTIVTPAAENPEWGWFRRWLFRIAPVFPAEAIVECNRVILFQGMNLFLVYVFEYSVQFVAPSCFPDFSSNKNGQHSPTSNNTTNTTTTTTTTTTTHIPTFSFTTTTMSPPIPTTNSSATSCSTNISPDSFDFMTRNAYVISQFCYQLGVLISRSSLSVVRIQRVEILTIFQFVNCICWIVLAKTEWLISECDPDKQLKYTVIMMMWMVLVGLQGGASYVNVFFNILNDAELQVKLEAIAAAELKRQKERKKNEEKRLGAEQPQLTPFKLNAKELTMNVSALYQTFGITTGSMLDVLLNNTLIKK